MSFPSYSFWLCSIFVLLLIISIIFNGVLFYMAKHYYTRAKISEVFPIHTEQYAEDNATLGQKTSKRVVLFGDSRIQEWTQLPNLNDFEFINRGISRETTEQIKGRFQADVLALNPDIVVLQLGGNDLTALGVKPQRYRSITQQCQTNIQFIVDTLLAREIKVILLTIIPPATPDLARRLVWDNKIDQAVADINHHLLSLPAVEGLYIIDTATVLKDADGQWRPDVNRDTLHLTSEGYRYLNDALILVLEKL